MNEQEHKELFGMMKEREEKRCAAASRPNAGAMFAACRKANRSGKLDGQSNHRMRGCSRPLPGGEDLGEGERQNTNYMD